MNLKEKAGLIYDAHEDKKGNHICVLSIEGLSIMTDCFVIADGENTNQIQAMADSVEEALGRQGITVTTIEGQAASGWILMDYGDIIVHIFEKSMRSFYDLERLWRDGISLSREDLHAMRENAEKDQ